MPGVRRGLDFDALGAESPTVPPAVTEDMRPADNPTFKPCDVHQADADEQIALPFVVHAASAIDPASPPREAWVDVPAASDLKYDDDDELPDQREPLEKHEQLAEATASKALPRTLPPPGPAPSASANRKDGVAAARASRPLAPQIPPALLALPRPVLAAAMRQKAAPEFANGSSVLGDGASQSISSVERQVRQAKRQWSEQHKLLQQRAALLAREILPQSSLSEHHLAELVAPYLAESAELEVSRAEEARSLSASRKRAAQLTSSLSSLVSHIGAGGSYMDELRAALEGADAEIDGLKARHASALEELGGRERDLTQELEAFARRIDGWAAEDAAAASSTATSPSPSALAGSSAVTAHSPRTIGAPRTRSARSRTSAPPPSSAGGPSGRNAGSTRASSATDGPSASAVCVATSADGLADCRDAKAEDEAAEEEAAMHAEVAAVDQLLLQLGGASCGWDAGDHAAYMRLRVQCLGGSALASASSTSAGAASSAGSTSACRDGIGVEADGSASRWQVLSTPRSDAAPHAAPHAAPSPKVAMMLERAARELPGHDLNSVTQHEHAVARREEALARRRAIVSAWRQKRRAAAEAAKAAAEAEAERAAAERARLGIAQRGSMRAAEEHRQKKLAQWKEAKMMEHAAQEEAQRRVSNEARRKAAADEARRAAVRDALADRAMKRAAEEAKLRSLQEKLKREKQRMQTKEKQIAMLAMQQRDAEATERKRYEAELRREALAKREARLRELAEAARPPVAKATVRDTERLTRPTQAHAVRRHEIASARRMGADDVPSRFGSSSLTFAAAGSRAVPAWRGGV